MAVSRVYETAPVGGPDQGPYLNAVAVLETDRSPRELLELLLATEEGLGRVRSERWGPRTADLDLLLYDGPPVDSPELTVPHPRARERAFVLVPLLDADPFAQLPGRRAGRRRPGPPRPRPGGRPGRGAGGLMGRGRLGFELLLGQVLDALPAAPATVVDAGGGAGQLAVALARHGYRVTVVDTSAAMLATCAQRAADAGAEVAERVASRATPPTSPACSARTARTRPSATTCSPGSTTRRPC